ncbi:MAG: ABC transporter ATP-binding protein [Phycisphaera sp.]|nr:MAG: ABC transporter ATP-binding protein [Phycisphaera sp.]
MATDYAIDIQNVAKTYKGLFKAGVPALRGIDMQVHRGEVFGLLGPNGAGKSTLVKILMTVIRASRCSGTMLGKPIGDKAALQRVGYLPEHHSFPPYLTGTQLIEFFGAMSNVNRRDRKRRASELLELVGMGDWGNKKLGSYSKGMRQRVGIAQSLINDPDLVLLDEPTDGVDPVGRRDIRRILEHLRDEGKTVLVNSHILSELEQVSSRVAILVQGAVAKQGTIEELTSGQERYEIELDSQSAPILQSYAGQKIANHAVEIEGSRLLISSDDPAQIQPIIDSIRSKNGTILAIKRTRPSLEDLFMQAVTDPETGETLAPGAAKMSKKGGA